MMLDPSKIAYLGSGRWKKLGRLNVAEIPQLGESIDSAGPTALKRCRTSRSCG